MLAAAGIFATAIPRLIEPQPLEAPVLGLALSAAASGINLAVGGYNTVQQVATLRTVGLAFRPDVVILGLVTIVIATGGAYWLSNTRLF